ncbi:1-acyl-sn-glycerol-3-phosphate acyltransferase [Lusitaniella coriacea LEGE 07157]|uniref:1-acyl-sn-glycerol-3-phosphate acyltransferase n=1 Tax=Lusitaniella coriacea LEGE 07157 TaxID=945747 RepID=A0A8J7E0Q3_9CYAN|nr:1-acyl-sn-glycerol-3-phosphate acyltransferase [Lusitaniella coriacea]MBE9118407.1 1-acyl-sn-glycerol-3-phosphate acyltransferase [Lusitaniella coriacea LEGE 07157]
MTDSANAPDFYPAQLNPVLVRLVQSFGWAIAPLKYHLNLEVEQADLDKIKALGDNRVVLMPNHPTFDDGIVLLLLSTRLGELFNYLVAHENFQGLQGKLLQLGGAYSIRRGVGDRASIAYTLKRLAESACRMVIFPEGGCSFQNDLVQPFRSGAIHLPLQAMNRLVKQNKTVPHFYLVPISLKYRYTRPMNREIDRILSQLEGELNLVPQTSDLYKRLRAVGERVLESLERDYTIEYETEEPRDWNQRITAIQTQVLERCETQLNLTPAPQMPARERVYKIQAMLESQGEELSAQERADIYRATMQLINFDAIYDGYVAAVPTQERFLDTLTRLEREVFRIDQPRPKGYRRAIVRVGDPIDLKDYFAAYQSNRTETVEKLTQMVQNAVQRNLDIMTSDPKPNN